MIKVITYGTYDLLHHGHIRLLERAKALGDYLIVGVTADDFDKVRGKINVRQTLMERVEAVRATGIADEIIIEEYEGQKIDDIKRYDVDIFTVGSDWVGKFDYLNEYCKVVYLERTQGVSSSELRDNKRKIDLGIIGDAPFLIKLLDEIQYVNGVKLSGVCTTEKVRFVNKFSGLITDDFEELLSCSDAVYIHSYPQLHFSQVKKALESGKHVLCESPLSFSTKEFMELKKLAESNSCILMEAIRTAYSTAFSRLVLLVKGGKIGEVVSIDTTCTSLKQVEDKDASRDYYWNSISAWGPTAMLPIFKVLGTGFDDVKIVSKIIGNNKKYDVFSKINFEYPNATASAKVGTGVKSEGELIISGTKGYVYVPAPWWKTDYFEIRYENPADNKRYFYQLDGEGIRYELVSFVKSIEIGNSSKHAQIEDSISRCFSEVFQMFNEGECVKYLNYW